MNNLALLLSLPMGILCWGWCLCVAWSWFAPVVSLVLPLLTFAQCVAIRSTLSFGMWQGATYQPTQTDPEQEAKRTKHVVASAVFLPWAMLLISWIIHLFVHAPAGVTP